MNQQSAVSPNKQTLTEFMIYGANQVSMII